MKLLRVDIEGGFFDGAADRSDDFGGSLMVMLRRWGRHTLLVLGRGYRGAVGLRVWVRVIMVHQDRRRVVDMGTANVVRHSSLRRHSVDLGYLRR